MTERSTHYLRRSRHAGFPRRQAAVLCKWARVRDDTRPDRSWDHLVCWRACSWSGTPGEERWLSDGEGVTADTFWRWLSSQMARRTQLWTWMLPAVHTLTLLDFWQRITEGEWVLSREDGNDESEDRAGRAQAHGGLCVVENPPTVIVALQPLSSGSIRLLDVRNLGVGGAHELGLPAGDVRALAGWLQAWSACVEELNLGGLRSTAPAQAWHGWRHHYLQCGVLIHDNEEALGLERASVYPGRAECFRIGLVPGGATGVDASGFYPHCAIARPAPCRLKWCGRGTGREIGVAQDRGWVATVECRVRCDRPLLPCRHGGIVCWPVGTWNVVLPDPEYRAAVGNGLVRGIGRVALYEPDRPFDGFVSALWAARQKAQAAGDVPRGTCVKLLMNSLIGKLAAQERAWVDAPDALPCGMWETWTRVRQETPEEVERRIASATDERDRDPEPRGVNVRHRSIGAHTQRLVEGGETRESCPALAAHVYSVGRVRLAEWIDIAGRENVYYVDSDSLLLSTGGRERLAAAHQIRLGELGALRVQGVYKELRIGGIRDYTADAKTVRAGVPRGLALSGVGRSEYWCEETVPEGCQRHRAPQPIARLVTLPDFHPYRHGTVGADGWVSPLNVED